jgi:hypothetical protein
MNKKLSQLTEKDTQLDPNDLMLVSTSGVSKSVKVSTLEAPLKTYADNAVDAEESRAMAAESSLASSISSVNSSLQQEISDRQADVSAEESRALAAEQDLQNQISNILTNIDPASLDSLSELVTAFENADSNLNSAITSLSSSLNSALQTEISDRIADVNAEESRALAAESSLSSSISSVNSDLQSEISNRIADVNAEESRALAAESSLSTSISLAVPVGTMFMFAGSSAPTGFLLCDGSAVNRTTYSTLFSLIGSTYGSGNGSTTFNLPNPDVNNNLRYIIKF